jgi:purine-binding chemotaxis protein CheW
MKSAPAKGKDSQAIMRMRAAAFARVPESGAERDAVVEVVEFSVSDERYAVEATCVSEVLPFSNCTPVPCTPAFVVGLVNVRGKILHIIDLRCFFELPARGIVDLHHILVVRHGKIELGILADQISGMRRVPLEALQSSLPTLTDIRADYLKGVTADRLAVLDVARILSDRSQIVEEEVEK